MDINVTTRSNDLSSIISTLFEVFTDRNILFIFSLILLVLILYIYILLRGSRWILKWYSAQNIEKSESAILYSILEELSKKAGIVTPELLCFESKIPEMFTVGNGLKSHIAISTAMMEMFDEIELEVLLAHEIGHIKNKDVAWNTFAAFVAGLIMSIPDVVMWGSLLIGFGQPEDPAPKFFKFMGTAFAAPPAAVLVHLTNPVNKEFAADEISINLTGNSRTLSKTLEYLENYIPLQPVTDRFNPGYFHLFSTHTQQMRGYLAMFISLFDTHPRIEDRVARILKFSNQFEDDIFNRKYSRVPHFFDLRSWRFALAASLISYLLILFLVLAFVAFALKDFNTILRGIIAVVYLGSMLLLMFVTARLSRRSHYLNNNCIPFKLSKKP